MNNCHNTNRVKIPVKKHFEWIKWIKNYIKNSPNIVPSSPKVRECTNHNQKEYTFCNAGKKCILSLQFQEAGEIGIKCVGKGMCGVGEVSGMWVRVRIKGMHARGRRRLHSSSHSDGHAPRCQTSSQTDRQTIERDLFSIRAMRFKIIVRSLDTPCRTRCRTLDSTPRPD